MKLGNIRTHWQVQENYIKEQSSLHGYKIRIVSPKEKDLAESTETPISTSKTLFQRFHLFGD